MERNRRRVGVVIAAGGKGTRLGGNTPKQFLLLKGMTVLERTVELFDGLDGVHEIVIAAPESQLDRVRRIIRRSGCTKVSAVVVGGRERQDSVWNGLNAFTQRPDVVLVHDAVRPFIDGGSVTKVIRQAGRYGAAVIGVPVKDTIKVEGRRGFYAKTLDRSTLWAVQTPQGFRFTLLYDAHRLARRSGFLGTDEASLVEHAGVPVKIVQGDEANLKITTRRDFALAKWLLK